MSDKEKKSIEEEESSEFILTDEETGEDIRFTVRARAHIEGKLYYALSPMDEDDDIIVFSATEDGDDILFETIDDDDEYDTVEDYFNDLLFNEFDYDEK